NELPIEDISVPGCPNMFKQAGDTKKDDEEGTVTHATVVVEARTAMSGSSALVSGQSYSNLVIGAYTGTLNGFEAEINWGDGTPATSGTVSSSVIKGAHYYYR